MAPGGAGRRPPRQPAGRRRYAGGQRRYPGELPALRLGNLAFGDSSRGMVMQITQICEGNDPNGGICLLQPVPGVLPILIITVFFCGTWRANFREEAGLKEWREGCQHHAVG
jgi:hypothetical protein